MNNRSRDFRKRFTKSDKVMIWKLGKEPIPLSIEYSAWTRLDVSKVFKSKMKKSFWSSV